MKMAYTMSCTMVVLVLLALLPISSACNKEDHKALLSIFTSFPPNSFPATWNSSDVDCCHWDYVMCDPSTGRVNVLQITDNTKVKGPIPPAIGQLSSLDFMILRDLPNLYGPIPRQLSKLRKLLFFIISNTSVSGPIPNFLSRYPNTLAGIDLSNNRLSGPIPASLGDLTGVSLIKLFGNKLSGNIPGSLFGKLHSKDGIQLDLSDNKLTGEIPKSFGHRRFITINLSNNQLVGDASFLFGKNKQLASMLLAKNRFSFDLTNVKYPDLEYFDISHNQIYGSLSDQITHFTNLEHIDVSYNKLCGKIPSGGSLSNFNSSALFAHNKCLCGMPLPPCK